MYSPPFPTILYISKYVPAGRHVLRGVYKILIYILSLDALTQHRNIESIEYVTTLRTYIIIIMVLFFRHVR